MNAANAELAAAADSPDLLSDCRVMLRFALKEGLLIPDDLRHDIAALDRELVKMNLAPISAIPPSFVADRPDTDLSESARLAERDAMSASVGDATQADVAKGAVLTAKMQSQSATATEEGQNG